MQTTSTQIPSSQDITPNSSKCMKTFINSSNFKAIAPNHINLIMRHQKTPELHALIAYPTGAKILNKPASLSTCYTHATNPLLSAYKVMEGMFSFNRTTMAPIGTEVMIHVEQQGDIMPSTLGTLH
ncbi:hypothetical protein ACHAW6_002723 [Cyclotella cf. meneghiniana]